MAITTVLVPPSRADTPATFDDDADQFASDLVTWTGEVNTLQTDVNAKQVLADASATAAAVSETNAAASAASAGGYVTTAQAAAAAAESAAALPTDPDFGRIIPTMGTAVVETSNFTAEVGKTHLVDTTLGAITVTAPAGMVTGDWFGIVDYAGTFNLFNVTVNSAALAGPEAQAGRGLPD